MIIREKYEFVSLPSLFTINKFTIKTGVPSAAEIEWTLAEIRRESLCYFIRKIMKI